MENERVIGRVVHVESERVTVELDSDSKSLTKTFLTGTYPIARINSYVIIPVGSVSIVGIVTRVSMSEQNLEVASRSTITLSLPRRTISITMVGTIKKNKDKLSFSYGIADFPALNNPVWFILEQELDVIFDKKDADKFFIDLGSSTAYPEYKVKLNPSKLFSRHLAVLGNTGGGKSCTIASLLQTILNHEDVVKGEGAHFVIFDTNGEYKNAFQRDEETGKNQSFELLHIDQDGLRIPYWFMNLQDFRQMFRVTGNVQEPVLSTAISIAKRDERIQQKETLGIEEVIILLAREFENIKSDLVPSSPKAEGFISKNILADCKSIVGLLQDYSSEIAIIEMEIGLSVGHINLAIEEIMKNCPEGDFAKVTAVQKATIQKVCSGVFDKLASLAESLSASEIVCGFQDVDSPCYFKLSEFYERSLPLAMKIQGGKDDRIKEYCSTMLLRIKRMLNDERYVSIFQHLEKHNNALAFFMRMCLGRMKFAPLESTTTYEADYFLQKYLASHASSARKNYQISIFDLSLIPSDVLENVTALLGRLILEFLQRIEKTDRYKDKDCRGKFPVVMVLEEAHNYIPECLPRDKESVSKAVFERIAREGRKYGLSLVVSSQRPSELSKTVLSQCNSFITHRIQNPEDQRYIKQLLPTISHDLLNQLPILAQGVALVFGDCVRAPMEVSVRLPDPRPDSNDPDIWKHWTNTYDRGENVFENGEPNFEEVCRTWEGNKADDGKINPNSKFAGNQLPGPDLSSSTDTQ